MHRALQPIRTGFLGATLLLLLGSPGLAQAAALRGKVVIDGSSTVYPIVEAAAASFRKEFRKVAITVAVSGTGGGFKRFTAGETDISAASRPIKPGEFEVAKANGIQFLEIPIALDGLSVVVNPRNTWATQLSIDELRAIYLDGGKATRWSDLKPTWPAQPIKIYSPGTDSGTFDYFKEVIVGEGQSFRPTMSASEDDNQLVTGVSGDLYSVGYFGASYYFENLDKLKAVAIVNTHGTAVLPEPENVIDGSYAPLSRPLFIYVNVKSARRPEVREFVKYFLAHDAEFATEADYVAVPEPIGVLAEEFLRTRATGTSYVTPGGEKREGPLAICYTRANLHDTQ